MKWNKIFPFVFSISADKKLKQFIYNKCMIMFASFYSHKLKCKDIDMFYLDFI